MLLRSKDSQMCCLGFLSLACGLTAEQIVDRDTVRAVVVGDGPFERPSVSRQDRPTAIETPEDLAFLVSEEEGRRNNSHIASRLMNINDEEGIGDTYREMQIADIMREHGWDVEFVN